MKESVTGLSFRNLFSAENAESCKDSCRVFLQGRDGQINSLESSSQYLGGGEKGRKEILLEALGRRQPTAD